MGSITRFGVSLEQDLLTAFDGLIAVEGYPNRSEALRDLIREALRGDEVARGTGPQVGVLALLFDHERPGLSHRITRTFHDHAAQTVASMHVHVSQRLCLEVIVLRGSAQDLRGLGASVRAMKGVLLGDLFLVPAEPEARRGVPT